MKRIVAILAAACGLAALIAQDSPSVSLGTVVSTNSIVGVRRRIVVDFPDSGPPVTTVLYVVRRMDGAAIVTERALEPVVIEWPALTNRYPEVNVILPRMNTDMATRLANASP
jgi:hypothetical protein